MKKENVCYYFGFGIMVLLTAFSIGHVQGQCQKENSEETLTNIKQRISRTNKNGDYVVLYQNMKREYLKLMKDTFDCEDTENLLDEWDKTEKNLLDTIKKSCPDFELSYEEIEQCRRNLDVYNFDKDPKKYCSTFEKCFIMHGKMCAPLKELFLLDNRKSNASVNFCPLECDDIQKLKEVLENCWAGTLIRGKQSSSQRFDLFSDCVIASREPTCWITKKIMFRIFPLYHSSPEELITIKENPEIKCIQDWKVLKERENLSSNLCKLLKDMKTCITTFLAGNDKKYKEKVAKCQYIPVNMIKRETYQQTTQKPSPVPSTAAGKLSSGAYHLVVISCLITNGYYFHKII